MKNQSKTSVSPQIYFLSNILELISAGDIRVPNFQRPFVWKPNDMIALFESIESGYPIGSLIFWKTENKYKTLPQIGPFLLPKSEKPSIRLILDGHQRLSTLYGVLSSPINKTITRKDNFWIWKLFYDLREKKFIHIRKGEPEPHFIKLNSLLRTIDFLKEVDRIKAACEENAEEYIERAEKLAQIFMEYQVAATQIEGGDLDRAVNIFYRLNSKGIRIATDRMYSALTYREGDNQFNLSDRIDEIQIKLRHYSFGGIKRMSIFRSILAASGENIFTKERRSILEDNKTDIANIVNRCEKSLIKAVQFLKEDIRVPDDNFLPYNLQLIVLSEFFRLSPEPDENIKSKLRQWFWVTSFVGLDTSKTRQVVEEMKKFAKSNNPDFAFKVVDFTEEAQPFPSQFYLTSARVRAYVLFLLSLSPKSFDKGKFDADVSLKEGYKAIPYILPRRGSRLSNRILLGNVTYGFLKKVLKDVKGLYKKQLTKKVLKSHAISKSALDAIQSGNDDLFLDIREKDLIRIEREFMLEKKVVPNANLNTQEPFSDTE